jgi:predicted nucleotidyltransferase
VQKSPSEPNDAAAAAARDVCRAVGSHWEARLGNGLLGAYLLGSLAHGGFSRRYSDIDMALVVETPLSPAVLDALRADAASVSGDLAAKLSIFWADRDFVTGRFPVLDRVDYLDHSAALMERERVVPSRPTLAEIRGYLSGAPFANWSVDAKRFATAEALEPKDHKIFLRTLLYPARLIYSWTTGRIGSNDDAVGFLTDHAPPDLDVELVVQALECRRADADPNHLFPARSGLPGQVAACEPLIAAA